MASIKLYTLKKSGEQRYEVFISNGINKGTGKQNKIHKKGFKTWEEANRFAKITEGNLAGGDYFKKNPEKMKLSDFLNEWINEYKINVKEGTRIVHRENTPMYINPYIGNFKLEDYTKKEHQKFINSLFTLKGKGRSGNGLSYNTVKVVNATLSNAFKKAIQLDYLKENPTKYVEFPPPPKEANEVPEHFTASEVDQFLNQAKKEHDPLWYPFFLLVFDSGLRKAEVIALKWSDFDLKKGTISVTRERLYRAEKKENVGTIAIDDIKTPRGNRSMPITNRTKNGTD